MIDDILMTLCDFRKRWSFADMALHSFHVWYWSSWTSGVLYRLLPFCSSLLTISCGTVAFKSSLLRCKCERSLSQHAVTNISRLSWKLPFVFLHCASAQELCLWCQFSSCVVTVWSKLSGLMFVGQIKCCSKCLFCSLFKFKLMYQGKHSLVQGRPATRWR